MKLSTFGLSAIALFVFASSAPGAWPFGGKKDKVPAPATQVTGSEPLQAAPAPAANVDLGGDVITNKNGQFVMRPHLKLDEKAEVEFRALLSTRVQATEDLYVLKRIQDEKQQEVARFVEQLRDDFGIEEKNNYEYDAEKGIIVQLIAKPGATPPATNAAPLKVADFDRKDHRKLDKKEDQERFVRLVASKQLSIDEIQTLTLLYNEKTIELQMIQNNINKKYSTSSDRSYRYDRDSKTLYEMVPVPEAVAGTPAPTGTKDAGLTK